ncbi:MAG: ABC transporter permease [Treponema sp.]|jgi:simple sugar transport system permease protein|nr:ABC transporter permease [Treponema sp.]
MKERSKLTGGPPQTQVFRPLPVYAGIYIPVISLLAVILLVFILSDTPVRTLYFFFIGPFSNLFSFGNMLNASVPLVIGALGVTIAMKAGNFNLGGEGQIYSGAFCTTAISLLLSKYGIGQSGVITGILAVTSGFVCAGLLGVFSGFCKAMWNTSELITSFLLSCAVIPVVNYLVCVPFNDPQSSLQSTRKIAENLRLPLILKPSVLSAGFFIAVGMVIIAQFFLKRTKPGYEIRMTGSNELFARYGGINTKLITVASMAVSAGFYGLAGSMAVMGTYHAVIKEFSAGLGWNGLAVALISGFNPSAVIPSALFFAWIGTGARTAMQNTGLTYEVASIAQAVIFFISTSLVIRNIYSKRGKTDV